MFMKSLLSRLKEWLSGLSFRTGVIVLLCCIPCYILSFAQMALPISVELKGILWFILFGMAKTFQYGGITILGVEGVKRLNTDSLQVDNVYPLRRFVSLSRGVQRC